MKRLLFSVTMKDLEMQTFRVGGAGGGGKDTSSSGVRLIHPPSGAVGEGREHRSVTINRRDAFLRLANSEKFKAWHKLECARRMGGAVEAEAQVRSDAAFGANKIRTYNQKQDRVTDHRVGKDYPLREVLDGKLGPVIHDLLEATRK